tara:strand:- start:781 stop:1152 length:372 start_codon:yes stop_codon:yes gene_type:complete
MFCGSFKKERFVVMGSGALFNWVTDNVGKGVNSFASGRFDQDFFTAVLSTAHTLEAVERFDMFLSYRPKDTPNISAKGRKDISHKAGSVVTPSIESEAVIRETTNTQTGSTGATTSHLRRCHV